MFAQTHLDGASPAAQVALTPRNTGTLSDVHGNQAAGDNGSVLSDGANDSVDADKAKQNLNGRY